MVSSEIEPIKIVSFDYGVLGFAQFHFGPGPWFAIRGHQFLPGGIHANVRMCEIVVYGWGTFMGTWEGGNGPDGGREVP